MAGTIFGLALSQQFDDNGDPLAGCKLYIYDAGTSTPAVAYEDFGLTVGLELSHPMVADSAGRIPQFWLADGSYRVRLVDADGNEIFDMSSVTALGASSGSVSTGSGVSDTALIQTGDFIWNPVSGTRTGFVRANGRTIGSSSSGGTERASSDCEDLFLFLWNNFSNSDCAVSGGRGGSAAADWAANKTIATLSMRGRCPYGLDDMGNSAASIISGATTAAAALGQESKVLVQGNLPSLNFSHSLTAASHTHDTSGMTAALTLAPVTDVSANGTAAQGAGAQTALGTPLTVTKNAVLVTLSGNTGASGALTVSGTVSSGGSGTAVATLSPGRAGTWYIRL